MSSNKRRPLLSIVIPTRNRQKFAEVCVDSLLSIPDDDLEVVIQDNSDTEKLGEYFRSHVQDSRLRYHYSSGPLSIIHNFEAAARVATGHYLCFIGDDDSVNPEIMDAARWAMSNDIDTLKPASNAFYLWPGSKRASTMFSDVPQETGRLTINRFSEGVVYPDNERELAKLARKGGQEYLSIELPKLYHGIVRRECLDLVFQKTGNYFGGLSPDIFAAVSLAICARKSVFIDYPLTLPGACPKSASIDDQVGNHTGDLSDAPHLVNRGSYEWADRVPRYYSVRTIWADSAIAALRDMGRDDLLGKFNLPYLAAACLWSDSGYARIILGDYYRSQSRLGKRFIASTYLLFTSFLTGPIRLLLKRIANRVRIIVRGQNFSQIDDVGDTKVAVGKLVDHLKENGKSFSVCVGRSII